ncbi:hypothetical protein [Psychromonas sp. Urea-02u-13]|uniref:hypothetical protein n=1 Tax=Psychromonas sp. Urea-02u-13 TaxID=2058326 RepID=UPI000C34443C|nr:hypothetical protein [Psychromonas sp. Urea-02u-13]PKG37493.1 hypothetical protein CXF74_18645 [Psychromonas sp. Urea-02u-13]
MFYIKAFIAGIVGTLIGGLILGFLVDLIFTNWVASGSAKFGNWAAWTGAFFTLFAAIAAGIAARGALKTLSFMRIQHADLATENTNRFEHEKNVWKEQKEMLFFQKHREHKQQFYNTLNDLQKEHSISFYNRSNLYSSIYPKNRFDHCDYEVDLNDDGALGHKNLHYLFNDISESLSKFVNFSGIKLQKHIEDHLNKLLRFSSLLHINFNDDNKTGDLYWNVDQLNSKVYILNIFDSLKSTIVMQNVFFEMLSFSGNELPANINHQRTNVYQKSLSSFFYTPHYRSSYIPNKQEVNTFLKELISFSDVISSSDIYRQSNHLWMHHCHVELFFYNPKNKDVSLENCDVLVKLFEKRISAITLFHGEKNGLNLPLQHHLFATEVQLKNLVSRHSARL